MNAVQAIVDKFVAYIVNPAILLLFSFGLLMFVYGLTEYLYNLSKGGETKTGRDHMLWGLLGMFIMVSVFGIIRLLNDTFGFGLGPGGSYNPDMTTVNALGGIKGP